MADIILRQDGQLPIATQIRYKDMGDGSFALVCSTPGLIVGEDCDGNELAFRVDADTRGLVVVSHYEEAVHESNRFKSSYLKPSGSELADDATHNFLIIVGSAGAHATLRVGVGGNSSLLFYEGTTVSDNGVALDAVSKNRMVVGTPETVVYSVPTVTLVGTLLLSLFVPGGVKKAVSGGDWGAPEWVLAPSTNYLVRVTNRSGAAIQFSFSLGWGEY